MAETTRKRFGELTRGVFAVLIAGNTFEEAEEAA